MENSQNQYLIPGAIVLAGIIVAGAVMASNNGANIGPDTFGNSNSAAAENIRRVTEEDHIFGNPKAKVSLIEFSDFECPFCQRHHPTLASAVEEFGDDVNWVYRHFPLTQIHSEARPSAIASECVAKIAGNDAFWQFSDALFENQDKLGKDLYNSLISDIGISQNDFDTCIASNDIANLVDEDQEEAIAGGANGTPFTVVVSKKGIFPFSGALPYDQVKQIVEQAM